MSLTKVSFSMIDGAVVNVLDYGADPTGVADSYAAIQAALNFATFSGSAGKGLVVYLPAGQYLISDTLEIPNATVFTGDGRQQTVIRPFNNSFSGVMITDKGNASKIFLQNFRIEALNYSGVTNLIKMGYGTEPVAQSVWNNIFFSGGIPGVGSLTTCTGIDIVTNVASLCEIEGGYCGTDFKLGAGSTVTTFDRCFTISAANYGFQLNGSANLVNCEIEAPALACVGVYASRETVIEGLTYSGAYNNPYAIEIDVACPLFTMAGFVNFQTVGTQLTEVIKDNRTNYPAYWGTPTSALRNTGVTADSVFSAGYNFSQNLQEQNFLFFLFNDAGTIKHSIQAQYGAGATSLFANKIANQTATYTTTPTGSDATTAFAAGAKIASFNTSVILLNTLSQTNSSRWKYNCSIVLNSSGTALTAGMITNVSTNVNGVTRNYVGIQVLDAASGSAFDLTTLGSNDSIVFNISAYIQ